MGQGGNRRVVASDFPEWALVEASFMMEGNAMLYSRWQEHYPSCPVCRVRVEGSQSGKKWCVVAGATTILADTYLNYSEVDWSTASG